MGEVRRIGIGLLLLAGAQPGPAAPTKPPRDAPYCALPGARPIFVAPMGEVFREAAGQPYPSAAWIAAADRNGDGAVDRSEMLADADRFFRRLDRDGDGRLTPEEVADYERTVAPEINLYADRDEPASRGRGRGLSTLVGLPDGAAGYGGPMGAGRFAWLNIPEPVAATDADVNRVVDRAEFLEAAGRRFDALDTARTGPLRLAALPRTPQQIAIEGPCRPRPKPRRPRDRDGWDDAAEEKTPR